MLPARRLLVSFFAAALVLACSATAGIPARPLGNSSPTVSDYFPLKKGAYWVYQGPIKWTKPDSSEVVEQEVTWKMQVEQVLQRNGIIGYEMTGAPWDLAWYDPAKEPGKYGIIQMGGKFYKTPVETVARLSNDQDDLSDLVNEGSLLLDTPLKAGKIFGDPAFLIRSDYMYCWVVGEMKPFEASGIKGIHPAQGLQEYPVVMRTNPDTSAISFVPGVGISGYSYIHHGTVSEVDVHLIEYYPGK